MKIFQRSKVRITKTSQSRPIHFSGPAALMSADIDDHWSVAVLTVTVHSSFFPTFDFFKNMLLSALDSIS